VAPVSWFIAHDVEEGRDHLNFTEWESLPDSERVHAKKEILDEVSEGDMPLGAYLMLHPDSKLDKKDLEILKRWIESANDK
jgi:hypothetical protein